MGFFDWLNKEEESSVEEVSVKKDTNFSDFKKVTTFIYEKSGITDLDKRALTASRLKHYATSKDVYTTDEFVLSMQKNSDFYQDIINIATVNETFFLREVKELEWLVKHIKKLNRPLKILSMPCSSGEEIYSILLMLCRDGIDISTIDIRGYDINSAAVELAKEGLYSTHSLHKIDENIKEKYFIKSDKNKYEINSKLKNNASFYQKNIFSLVNTQERYDIIISRNMFIYFDDENRSKALNIIASLLKTDGIYIKGHADHIKAHPNLKNIEFGIYQKTL